ncbi:flagellar export protein FliJ [Vibrio sp. ZSDE26]|uniref:Flagellar FliJ protein n=1 Tax=Vibrio amylolyticus TaxID=2847292 RepID=A0A9X1XPW8_9VIBR|nr:flagellar export protein FliJ [Vibrio amylolyticus]MCK6263364.1 flagellar export protein FliJ [Vibrio amylolyticus]
MARGLKGSGLAKFRDMNQDQLERLSQQLQKQQTQSDLHQNHANQLMDIYDSVQVSDGESAMAWRNRDQLRSNLQHLQSLQMQQMALSKAEHRRIQQHVLNQNVRVKSLDTVLEKRRKTALQKERRIEQAMNDEIGAQRHTINKLNAQVLR